MQPTTPETSWWAALSQRLAGAAVAAGATSPGRSRRYWSAGQVAHDPTTSTTPFYAGSITKQLIAVLVARAVLDGHVDTRASIRTYLPGLPAWTVPVQVHHLLHHTAGLPQPRQLAVVLGGTSDAAGWSQLDNAAVLAALHQVAPSPAPPGHRFSYDNTGYVLLAELLAAVHGRSVVDLVSSDVLSPLGLDDSHVGGAPPVTLPEQADPPGTIGDGGLWTCAADLVTWLEALNQDRLGPDVTALVQSPGHLDDGTVLDYAWGTALRPGPTATLLLHGGEWPGWCAMTVRCPTTGTAVALLAATEDMATVHTAALELHQLLEPPAA